MLSLSAHLEDFRITRNLTQNQLSNAIGFSVEEIRQVEQGKRRPSIDMLIAMANFFDVSLDFLAGRGDDPERRDASPIQRQIIAKLEMLSEENLQVVNVFIDALN